VSQTPGRLLPVEKAIIDANAQYIEVWKPQTKRRTGFPRPHIPRRSKEQEVEIQAKIEHICLGDGLQQVDYHLTWSPHCFASRCRTGGIERISGENAVSHLTVRGKSRRKDRKRRRDDHETKGKWNYKRHWKMLDYHRSQDEATLWSLYIVKEFFWLLARRILQGSQTKSHTRTVWLQDRSRRFWENKIHVRIRWPHP